MSQYTPEPWAISPKINQVIIAQSDEFITIDGAIGQEAYDYYGGNLVGESISPNNAKRIVQCVNACAGIEDPAAYIADLQSRLDLAVKELEELKAKQPKIIMEVDGKTIATFFGEATLTQIKGGSDDNR